MALGGGFILQKCKIFPYGGRARRIICPSDIREKPVFRVLNVSAAQFRSTPIASP